MCVMGWLYRRSRYVDDVSVISRYSGIKGMVPRVIQNGFAVRVFNGLFVLRNPAKS